MGHNVCDTQNIHSESLRIRADFSTGFNKASEVEASSCPLVNYYIRLL